MFPSFWVGRRRDTITLGIRLKTDIAYQNALYLFKSQLLIYLSKYKINYHKMYNVL